MRLIACERSCASSVVLILLHLLQLPCLILPPMILRPNSFETKLQRDIVRESKILVWKIDRARYTLSNDLEQLTYLFRTKHVIIF